MGYGIYTKNYTDKFGKIALFLKIDSSEGVYRKTIPEIKINLKHYDLSCTVPYPKVKAYQYKSCSK